MKKEKIKVILAVCGTIAILFAFGYIEKTACNPKGSIAAKINWAGNGVCSG